MQCRLGIAGVSVFLWLGIQPEAAAAPTWKASIYPESQLFPSLLISTATEGASAKGDPWDGPQIGDLNGLIGGFIHDVKKGDRVRVVVKENALMEQSVFEDVSPKTTKRLLVHPRIKYRYPALALIRQNQPLDVNIEAWLNGTSLGEQTVTANVHSINDCLIAVLGSDGKVKLDATLNFAAYVNEDHPAIDDVLREALELGEARAFDGYQSGKPERVLLQISAIWDALQRRGMRYSDVKTTADESNTVVAQYVRFFDESLRAKQANCADGSVMLASVLRKIGLTTYLVIEPHHMFVAVDLTEDDDSSMIGIETTMMGDGNLERLDAVDAASARQREKLKNQASFKTFKFAVDFGTKRIEDHLRDFRKRGSDYQLVDLAAARSKGIMPIGYAP